MKKIEVYDLDAENLVAMADEIGTSVYEIVSAVMDAISENRIEVVDYL